MGEATKDERILPPGAVVFVPTGEVRRARYGEQYIGMSGKVHCSSNSSGTIGDVQILRRVESPAVEGAAESPLSRQLREETERDQEDFKGAMGDIPSTRLSAALAASRAAARFPGPPPTPKHVYSQTQGCWVLKDEQEPGPLPGRPLPPQFIRQDMPDKPAEPDWPRYYASNLQPGRFFLLANQNGRAMEMRPDADPVEKWTYDKVCEFTREGRWRRITAADARKKLHGAEPAGEKSSGDISLDLLVAHSLAAQELRAERAKLLSEDSIEVGRKAVEDVVIEYRDRRHRKEAMRVLVCGKRDWHWPHVVRAAIYALTPGTVVIHGACSGVDKLADKYAKEVGLAVEEFPADWDKYGRAAGPIRNAQMLKDGKPDYVLAFFPINADGSPRLFGGTYDMVKKAEASGVTVRIIVADW